MASTNNLSGDSMDLSEIEKKVRVEISKIKSKFNVLIIGKAGAGKSSFINSMHMALAHNWHEVANYGEAGGARAVTSDLVCYEMFRDELTEPPIEGYGHNILFWDTAGLENFESDVFEEFLGLIMEGRVPPGTNIHAYTDKKRTTVSSLRWRFRRPGVEENKCHRVVFVYAANEEPPLNLMSSVLTAAAKDDKDARNLPIFLVISKYDKICDDNRQVYETRKANAGQALMVAGNLQRCKEVFLYSTELTGLPQNDYRGMRSDNDINNNMLNLWMNLLSAAYRVKYDTGRTCSVS